ncbi:MAG: Ig-like domain-containing protein [Gammaproteobacteria bacterium]|nr:Ig-like domain-containing protein [Gammaproteobacteria bacterium]
MLRVNADGSYVFDPNGAFETLPGGQSGTVTFQYTVADPGGLTDTTSVSINVAGVNDAPEASGEEQIQHRRERDARGHDDGHRRLGNDTDIDGDTLLVDTSPLIKVSNGSLVLNDDGTFSYTPDTDFTCTDQFTYRVDDGNGGTSSATATIAVGLNEPPVAADDTASVPENSSVTGNVLLNDEDPNGDTLVIDTMPLTEPTSGVRHIDREW